MAKRRKLKVPKPRKVKYRTSIYQVQVKGPERNEAFRKIIDHIKGGLLRGKILQRGDRYGSVIRSVGGTEDRSLDALQLELVRYNQKATGLAWNIKSDEIVKDSQQVTAQLSDLIIYIGHHAAVLRHKPHGPTPSEMKDYLETLLRNAARALELDCIVEVIPLKVGGAASRIRSWRVIKKFSIEFLRPNPNPSAVRSKRLRLLLTKTDADKGKLDFEAKSSAGLNYNGIKDLVEEGKHLIERGQGHMLAKGIDREGHKDEVDSEKAKVLKIDVMTDTAETRSLAELFLQTLGKYFS